MVFRKTADVTVPVPPTAASEAIHPLVQELGYKHTDESTPGAAVLMFGVRQKFLRARLEGSIHLTESGTGSAIEVVIETAHEHQSGALDGRRNQKSADELAQRIADQLGTE